MCCTSIARSATKSESAVARTARGSDPMSSRAWSRNCLASETSSGFVTRPPPGATPTAYSLAASEAAATMRRGERQQHAVDAQLTRPSCRRAAEPHVRPPVGRARDLDLTPPDAACEGRALERLVDGL